MIDHYWVRRDGNLEPVERLGVVPEIEHRPQADVDAEGGQVMRLRPDAGYGPTLSARELGASNDLALAELEGLRIGRMLREAGINWNLAPVVDVGYNPANPVIVGYQRSFGADPQRVVAFATAWMNGRMASKPSTCASSSLCMKSTIASMTAICSASANLVNPFFAIAALRAVLNAFSARCASVGLTSTAGVSTGVFVFSIVCCAFFTKGPQRLSLLSSPSGKARHK